MSSNPTGLFIDTGSKWQIGPKLGSGACATVHKLLRVSSSGSITPSTYAVKIAPLPISKNTSKKRKKTPAERNADLLNYENMIYRNVLNDLRGHMVPDVPLSGPPGYGDIEGFRFLVMEQMEEPFTKIIPSLISSKQGNSVSLESVACRLIDLMEAIHENNHVFVDVKPENFMLGQPAAQTKSRKASKKSAASRSDNVLASRIKLIDMGLMENYNDVMNSKHRVDEYPNAQVVGTPVYASCNVLSGHSVGRRDDMEALGYIFCEVILQIKAHQKKGQGMIEDLLPWSQGKSDEEVLEMKERALKSEDGGKFWKSLGNHNKEVMDEYFDTIANMIFKEKPDYEYLKSIVSGLKVDLKESKTTAKRTKDSAATPMTSTRSRRATRSSAEEEYKYDEDVPPSQTMKTPGRTTRTSAKAREGAKSTIPSSSGKKKRVKKTTTIKEVTTIEYVDCLSDEAEEVEEAGKYDADGDVEMEECSVVSFQSANSSSNNESFETANWEVVDENESLDHNVESPPKQSVEKKKIGLKIICIQGPHEGESFFLDEKPVIIGQNPSNKSNHGKFEISDDNQAAASHVKVALSTSGSKQKGLVLMVRVTDMKSSEGTYINSKKLLKGGGRQAFVKDKIQVGDSIFQIQKA